MANSNQKVIEIEGMDDIIREIKSISDDKIKRKEILKMVRRQMKPIQKNIKKQANVIEAQKPIHNQVGLIQPGNLEDSIRMFTGKNKENAIIYVGPKMGTKQKDDGGDVATDGFYAGWIVYGSAKHNSPNDFIWKGAEPLMESVNTKLTLESERYIQRKIKQTKL